jgi:hypothetical protein
VNGQFQPLAALPPGKEPKKYANGKISEGEKEI